MVANTFAIGAQIAVVITVFLGVKRGSAPEALSAHLSHKLLAGMGGVDVHGIRV
jgi:hypothetical protein